MNSTWIEHGLHVNCVWIACDLYENCMRTDYRLYVDGRHCISNCIFSHIGLFFWTSFAYLDWVMQGTLSADVNFHFKSGQKVASRFEIREKLLPFLWNNEKRSKWGKVREEDGTTNPERNFGRNVLNDYTMRSQGFLSPDVAIRKFPLSSFNPPWIQPKRCLISRV